MSIRTKILFVTRPLIPPWDEASKNFAYFLARSIRDPRIEFHLLTGKEKLDGIGDTCVQHPIFPNGNFDLRAKVRLLAFLARHRRNFDGIHFLFTPTPFNSFLLKSLFGTHPHTIQTIATLREERWDRHDWEQMFFATQLITYTESSKNKLGDAGFSNVSTIYPGIDLDRFAPRAKDSETLEKLNISPRNFVVSYVGEYARLGATDMIADMLVRHLSHAASSDADDALVFLFALRVKNESDQRKKEEIQEKFREAGILKYIRFSDTVSDVASLYRVTDIVTFPVADMHGKFDVPLVIIEAYASGRPVILSDLPAFMEFSNPHISVTIPRGDSEALWQEIKQLQADQERRNALGMRARAFVEERFNLRKTSAEYQSAYLRAFKNHRSS